MSVINWIKEKFVRLEAVNRHLLELNDKGIFVTVLLGILNRVTRQFTYTRAGHELPIVIDQEGAVRQLYKGEGQALGIFDFVTLDEQLIDMSKNSLMLLYTDGVTDAINQHNEMFGIKGILDTLCNSNDQSVSKVCEELLDSVTKHQSHLPQFDDLTLVAVRAT
jgi:serine phosphatase RsbU (regulator of sigma subunit)